MRGKVAFLVLIILFVAAIIYKTSVSENYGWTKENKLIAHAFGGIDNKIYTNSLEAFKENYKKGIRVFEVDLITTEDRHLVARHDWGEKLSDMLEQHVPAERVGKPWTLKEFKDMKINKKYTALDFRDISELMHNYEDIYLVTDTKGINAELLALLVDTAKEIDPKILDRVIIQIYKKEDLETVKSIYNFKSLIFTLYMTALSDKDVVNFVSQMG